jgi:mannose-6-phosphate isomerase-like protein (cupin superfamily)
MPESDPFVIHEEQCAFEGWDDPQRGRVQWRTLISSDRTPTGDMTLGVVEIGPGRPELSYPHRHADAEAYYVLSGSGVVTIDGTEHPVLPGTALYIPGDCEHGVRNTGTGVLRILYVFAVDSFGEIRYEFPGS